MPSSAIWADYGLRSDKRRNSCYSEINGGGLKGIAYVD